MKKPDSPKTKSCWGSRFCTVEVSVLVATSLK